MRRDICFYMFKVDGSYVPYIQKHIDMQSVYPLNRYVLSKYPVHFVLGEELEICCWMLIVLFFPAG